jgi:hypothetical protein
LIATLSTIVASEFAARARLDSVALTGLLRELQRSEGLKQD